MYEPECMRIAKFCKRLMPLFEDIEEDIASLQGVALTRSCSSVKVCVCVCMCVSMCVHVCTRMCLYVCVRVYVCACARRCV